MQLAIFAGVERSTISGGTSNIVNSCTSERKAYAKAVAAALSQTERSMSSSIDRQINSLDDFKEHYFELNPQEYLKMQETGAKSEINYESEYQKYIKTRGCATESELQALNRSPYFTTDGFKAEARSQLSLIFSDMLGEGLEFENADDIDEYIDYIMKYSSTSDLADYVVSPSLPKGLKTSSQIAIARCKLLKELALKLPKDPAGKFDAGKLCSSLDKMINILKERDKKESDAPGELDKRKITDKKQPETSFSKADSLKKVSIYSA